jgi:hypothetical protein
MTIEPAALVRLYSALEPDLDPERLTDAELAELGVTREDVNQYVDFVGHVMAAAGDSDSADEQITEYLTALADYYEQERPHEATD